MKYNYSRLLDRNLRAVFQLGLRQSWQDPQQAVFFAATIYRQWRAAAQRLENARIGLYVTPLMIFSITRACNLSCRGCYARQRPERHLPELTTAEIYRILQQAEKLGISVVMLAGGEPFLRPDLLELTAKFPRLVFPIFTNGQLLDDAKIRRLARQRQVIPVLSLEGSGTDERRGAGVLDNCHRAARKLSQAGIFHGMSLTVTRENYAELTSDRFAQAATAQGTGLFFYVEYVPVQPGTEHLVLDPQQKADIDRHMHRLQQRHPGVFIAFPGDESVYDGCLAAGRGFIHVGPGGSLEPCPFAPFSDVNLREVPLAKALQSDFLARIRENHPELSETDGGCALWNRREWLQGLLGK